MVPNSVTDCDQADHELHNLSPPLTSLPGRFAALTRLYSVNVSTPFEHISYGRKHRPIRGYTPVELNLR